MLLCCMSCYASPLLESQRRGFPTFHIKTPLGEEPIVRREASTRGTESYRRTRIEGRGHSGRSGPTEARSKQRYGSGSTRKGTRSIAVVSSRVAIQPDAKLPKKERKSCDGAVRRERKKNRRSPRNDGTRHTRDDDLVTGRGKKED